MFLVFQDFPNHSLGIVEKEYFEWEERICELQKNLMFLKNKILDSQRNTAYILIKGKLKGYLVHEIMWKAS